MYVLIILKNNWNMLQCVSQTSQGLFPNVMEYWLTKGKFKQDNAAQVIRF